MVLPEGGVLVTLNGVLTELPAVGLTSLLRALRAAGFTGSQGGCEQGECGSCTVRLDGEVVCACLVPAAACAGRSIDTIEGGVAPDLAEALARHGAVQCGFCTPGVVLAAEAVLGRGAVTRAAVVEGLSGNLCRCTGYRAIVDAVVEVAGRRGSA